MNRRNWNRLIQTMVFTLLGLGLCYAQQPEKPLLLQTPTISARQIVFAYGGDLWIVGREGGPAHRLVTGTDLLSGPIFSPDGAIIAYTGNYNGNADVYVVPATGGEPRRLTYHPDPDYAQGWTPDSKEVLFRSKRSSPLDSDHLFTISIQGGFAKQLPLPMAENGSYSPDATHIAYQPIYQWEPFWQVYHGGQTLKIWIANLADSSVVEIPRPANTNDKNPMWIGDKIYFLSNRNGPVTLFVYDPATKKVSQLIKNTDGYDISSASTGAGVIVYSQFGTLHVYDPKSGKNTVVHVTVSGDMPQLRPHFVKVAKQILNSNISPTGKRAVFEAHGEILTVPSEKGDVRNLTQSPSVADRNPAWSPDGQSIAYFSDKSGEYALYVGSQNGLGPVKKIDLGDPPSFFYDPVWSPDSKMIAYTDKRLNLWYIDLANPTPVKVDTDKYLDALLTGGMRSAPRWSPDSKWLTYDKVLPNYLHAVFVYSLDAHKVSQVTDGMSDARYPAFDKDGKYLYFTASTNVGLSANNFDMTSDGHEVTRSVYVAVLRKDLPSPLAPESDDEKAKSNDASSATKKPEAKKPVTVTIDFDGLDQRVLALPLPARNYVDLQAGKKNILYLSQASGIVDLGAMPTLTIQQFDLKKRKTTQLLAGLSLFQISADGGSMLYRIGPSWFINPSAAPPAAGKGMLKTAGMEVKVDPRAEWNQMYNEVWRIERDFFYAPNYHGLSLPEAKEHFRPYLAGIASRNDLNYLFQEMLSYLSVGHMFVSGGEQPTTSHINVGLLGADYTVENDRYRFAKVYNGENWNPGLEAPLTQPGVNVKAGEYLLAVNGHEVHGTDNIYSFFQESAGQQTALKVGPNSDGSGSREVTVIPIASEGQLRHLDWINHNREMVDKLSGGKLAYVYLPNTAGGGFTNFNRYYFAQINKQGAIIDERNNHGGQIADYIIDYLKRQPLVMEVTRENQHFIHPSEAIFGPKVMIINQFAGSGGDAMPFLFREAKVGPLVGVRTWGGLVGIGGYPRLIDGGGVTAPRDALYGLNGHWVVENHGIPPDYEVQQDPKLVREGHDPQLEKAVEVDLELLKQHPPQQYQQPPYPNYHPQLPSRQ
ncbi:MAG: PDZ domain-containing protein [Acidobacteriaceae bacterium]